TQRPTLSWVAGPSVARMQPSSTRYSQSTLYRSRHATSSASVTFVRVIAETFSPTSRHGSGFADEHADAPTATASETVQISGPEERQGPAGTMISGSGGAKRGPAGTMIIAS